MKGEEIFDFTSFEKRQTHVSFNVKKTGNYLHVLFSGYLPPSGQTMNRIFKFAE